MQTHFTLAQLADPDISETNDILRACVHCGFCTATCPTYVTLGDELDSPRGRIYLMKQMFEADAPATTEVVTHIDRCLSCLSCMTTCPSGVNYQHLVDHGRKHIEETYTRPFMDRTLRALLAWSIPHPLRFRTMLAGALLARPFRGLFRGRLRAMLDLTPSDLGPPSPVDTPQVFAAEGTRKGRVALLNGCAQTVVAPQINEATIRLLTRLGVEVVVAEGMGCCGSLVQHMGKTDASHAQAAANIDAWLAEDARDGLDAIVINTSGCGTHVKDYGFLFREDAAYASKAARVSELASDVSEYLSTLAPEIDSFEEASSLRVTYHSACSMQHGQQIRTEPKALLVAAGFAISEPGEGHLCCGSAGTYNILQPELAGQLRDRKVTNIARTTPDVVATGNVGCMTQLGAALDAPVVHTVELLDWATGGPKPKGLG
ncbi:MAG: glycolate oxidase subunit GlcF [Alphaproteobacteria bacterium]|nr:glycolate oxidase subunit GlcF [Alphaproteobacteria bacterium]